MPAPIVQLIRRCLEKDPKRRFHDIADARIEIEDALEGPRGVDVATSSPGVSRRTAIGALAGAAAGAAATGVFTFGRGRTVNARDVMRFTIALPRGTL